MKIDRRWIEWGKDALILLLTLSAAYLLSMTPLVRDSGLSDLLSAGESPGVGTAGGEPAAAMLPSRLAICAEGGRFGVQYDEARLEECFPPLGALLGDALASAGGARAMSESEWQRCLGSKGVYFDFEGEVPLTALERWLQGTGAELLDGSARRVLLCAGEQDQVLLCWQEAGSGRFFASPTALTQSLHLDPVVEGVDFNGAYFAFENEGLSDLLEPYTLITEGEHGGAQYAASMPLAGESEVWAVLEAMSFSTQNHAPVSGGEVYLDGSDRLVVSDNGTVTYRAAQGEKYPVGDGLAGAVDTTRALAERTLGALCGEARLYLMSARETGETLCVRFGYLLGGGAVRLGADGWAAEFLVQDEHVAQFTLHFRSYAANGEHTLLLPIDKAAVMLPDLTDGRQELAIQYWDGGGTLLSPEWVAS